MVMRDARGGMKKTEEFRTKVLEIIHVGRSTGDENKICLKPSGRTKLCAQFPRSAFVYELELSLQYNYQDRVLLFLLGSQEKCPEFVILLLK